MVRLTLMYYIDFVAFMENPDKTWNNILAKEALKAPPEQTLFEVHPKSFVSNFWGALQNYLRAFFMLLFFAVC